MSNIRKILNISFILLAFTIVFSSCSKDDPLTETLTNQEVNEGNNDNANNLAQLLSTQGDASAVDSLEECFQINFPVTVNIPGGDAEVANSEDELWSIYEDFFKNADNNTTEFPTMQYPIDVTLADGTTQTVNNEEELCDLFLECYDWDDEGDWDDGEWGDDDVYAEFCFEYVYPLTIQMEDGSTQTINSEEDWYTVFDSLGTYEYFTLVYPLDIELTDGTIVTINSEEDLEPILEDCIGDIPGPGDCDSTDISELCFEFVYPLSIGLPDGSTVSVDDEEELFTTIIDYYEQNPDSEEEPTLVFPINVVLEDGTASTLNNEDELEDLLEECYGDGFGLVSQNNPIQGLATMSSSN